MNTTTGNVNIQKTNKQGFRYSDYFRSLTSLVLGQMEIFPLSYSLGARTNGNIYFLLRPWSRDKWNYIFHNIICAVTTQTRKKEGGREE